MSLRDPRVVEWEMRLKSIFDGIDDYLEDKYGSKYPLHPARAAKGRTADKEHDGLFNVGAVFSAGYGSEHGAGYIVEVRMSTLARVPRQLRREIESEVAEILREELPREFPGRDLQVSRDGHVYKIYGDLSLS